MQQHITSWQRASKDTEEFRSKPRWFWGVEVLGAAAIAGLTSGLLWGSTLLRWQVGLITFGVFVGGLFLIYSLIFLWNLLLAPKRLRNEARQEFIERNASYVSNIIGDVTKKKYLAILETLKLLIKTENTIADDMFGKHKMSNKEFIATREKLNQQTHITLPQTTKQYSAEEFSKKVNNIIHKFGLQIIGDKPTDKQVEFMIKTRSVLDECGIGLSKGLKYSDEYKELLKKFGEQVPTIDNKTPDWILFCLTIPSGINSAYLLWSYLPRNLKRQFFPNLPTLSKFKEQRELGIKELIQYANSSIEGSNQRLFDTNVS